MNKKIHYPNTRIEVRPGDIIYSSIGRSTYYVGHSVIVGTDYKIKEVIPIRQGWYEIDLIHFWARHRRGDQLTILRSYTGANEAATWITYNLHQFKKYTIFNHDFHNITHSYCYKFVAQAYAFGAGVCITPQSKRLLLPRDILQSPQLEKIAIIRI